MKEYWQKLLATDISPQDWDPFMAPTFVKEGACMPLPTFSAEAVGEYLATRKRTAAPGPDGVPYVLLLRLGLPVWSLMARGFTHVLRTGEVPRCWRITEISLLYKKGACQDPASFRPVALSSCLLKVMNALLANDMESFCRGHTTFNTSWQKGFLKGINGCVEHSHEVFEAMLKAASENEELAILFVDFSNAFSTVRQEAVWEILRRFGIHATVIAYIQNVYAAMSVQIRDYDFALGVGTGTLHIVPLRWRPNWTMHTDGRTASTR
jgi:hypothetical protein